MSFHFCPSFWPNIPKRQLRLQIIEKPMHSTIINWYWRVLHLEEHLEAFCALDKLGWVFIVMSRLITTQTHHLFNQNLTHSENKYVWTKEELCGDQTVINRAFNPEECDQRVGWEILGHLFKCYKFPWLSVHSPEEKQFGLAISTTIHSWWRHLLQTSKLTQCRLLWGILICFSVHCKLTRQVASRSRSSPPNPLDPGEQGSGCVHVCSATAFGSRVTDTHVPKYL